MTTISSSGIVRQAFRLMERDPLSSLADDTPEAIDAKEQFEIAMDEVLGRVDWSWASKRAELSPSEPAVPDADLPYFFVLPGDVLRLREVGPTGTKYRHDADGLYCAENGPLMVRYTSRLRNESRMPALVKTTVAFRLAFLLGPFWVQTASKIDALEQRYERSLKQAAREDSRSASGQRYDDLPQQPDWVESATW